MPIRQKKRRVLNLEMRDVRSGTTYKYLPILSEGTLSKTINISPVLRDVYDEDILHTL